MYITEAYISYETPAVMWTTTTCLMIDRLQPNIFVKTSNLDRNNLTWHIMSFANSLISSITITSERERERNSKKSQIKQLYISTLCCHTLNGTRRAARPLFICYVLFMKNQFCLVWIKSNYNCAAHPFYKKAALHIRLYFCCRLIYKPIQFT